MCDETNITGPTKPLLETGRNRYYHGVTYLRRLLDEPLAEMLATFPIVILDGARATGKTTTSARVASSEFRFPRDLALVESDPKQVLSAAKPPVLIDEWQLAGTELLWVLKDLVDKDATPGQFVLTGSVAPEDYGPTYPLTGRGVHLTMQPMSQRELAGRAGDQLWLRRLLDRELTVPGRRDPATGLGGLLRPGFPAAATAKRSKAWLRTYASTIAERTIDNRRDPERVMRLMRVLAESESQATPDEHLWRAADINRASFSSYVQMLSRTNVRGDLPAWETNRLKRLTRYPKWQYIDVSLALALADISADDLARDPGLAGRYLESFVAAQLRPECEVLDATMYHLRTKGGEHEVDLLVEVQGGLVAIEVKSGVQPRPIDAHHLVWLQHQLGERLRAAVVVHRGEATFELVPGVWAIPISTML